MFVSLLDIYRASVKRPSKMNIPFRVFWLLSILLIGVACTRHASTDRGAVFTAQKPQHEFRRGLWVRAASVASPDSIPRVLEIARNMNVTDIFIQAVVGGYAYYNSAILPRSQYLSRISEPGYDPLYSLISKCATTPIRVHAWVNALLYWSLDEPPDSVNHVLHRHPEWFIHDVNNRSMADYTYTQWKNSRLEGLYLDPQNHEVAVFVRDICAEIASQYAVDGIHLDFIRYPGILWGLPANDEAALLGGVDAGTALWCNIIRYGQSGIYERWKFWNAWRFTRGRQYTIARIVSDIHTSLETHARKDDCRLSAAVFANPSIYRYSLAQNWTEWTREAFLPVVMSYTPDIVLFSEYAKHALFHRPDAILGIGILWPEMIHGAGWQEQQVHDMEGPGICYFDFAAIDTMIETFIAANDTMREEREKIKIDSSRYLPVDHVFEHPARPELVREGISPVTWGNALHFSAFLLSLSMDPEMDLRRMGLTRAGFLEEICEDMAAFEYLNREIFPIGDVLNEPPTRSVRYCFIPWSGGDSLAIVEKANEINDFDNDTILYPQAMDPLTSASFKARTGKIEILYAPAGIYVFTVDSVYQGGGPVARQDVEPHLLPVYVNWTIRKKAERILGSID